MSVEFFRVGQESGGVNKPGAASKIFRRTSSRNQFDLVLPGKGHGAHRCELYEFAQEVHGVSAGDYLYLHIRLIKCSRFNYNSELCINVRKIKTRKTWRRPRKTPYKSIIHNNCRSQLSPPWSCGKLAVPSNSRNQAAKSQHHASPGASV